MELETLATISYGGISLLIFFLTSGGHLLAFIFGTVIGIMLGELYRSEVQAAQLAAASFAGMKEEDDDDGQD